MHNTVSIMQPYFLPYLGYWQLISLSDIFVIYDDIEFTKKGWINRNNYLINGKKTVFTLPLKKDSDFLSVNERFISEEFKKSKLKILNQFSSSYKKSEYFDESFFLFKKILDNEDLNLFNFIRSSITEILSYLDIKTEIKVSSSIGEYSKIKGKDKVFEICKKLRASKYVNPIGGLELYSPEDFAKNKIDLYFHKINKIEYRQIMVNDFEPNLSIIDVIAMNGKERTIQLLDSYSLI